MSLPNVSVTLGNGNIGGAVATTDGCIGIVMTGATEGTVTAGTPFLVSNAADVAALGLTSGNNAFALKTLNEFVAEAQNQGIDQWKLYVLLTASTMKVNMMADVTNTDGAKKLVDYAAGAMRVIIVCADDSRVYPSNDQNVTAGINADCYTAISNLQTLCTTYATAQQPLRGVVGGTSYSGTAANLTNQLTNSKNRVLCLIGDTASGNGCAIGVLAARLAAIPVQRKISRVKNGPIASTTAYIATTKAELYSSTETMHDKGFVTFRTFANKTGYYFSSDQTCCPATDDYHLLSRGRVIDKAQILAYATYVEEVDDEVPVNTDGTIDAGYALWLEQQIENQLGLTMTAAGEISTATAYVDPAQNVISNSTVNIVLKIVPVGYASAINILLSFDNPANG